MFFSGMMRFAIIGLFCAGGIGHAQAAEAIDVTWPQGWEVQSASTRTGGSNRTAVRTGEGGQFGAMIAIVSLPNPATRPRQLPGIEMQSVLRTIRQGYTNATCDAPVETTLVGAPALESTCRGKTTGGVDIIHTVTIAHVGETGQHVLTLSCITSRDHLETYQADFTAVRNSLRLAQ